MTSHETAFIAKQTRKHELSLRCLLRRIARTESVSQRAVEVLTVNDLIQFVGPDGSCPWNHFRLTARGKAELNRLEGGAI
jgi:hypothetical protein